MSFSFSLAPPPADALAAVQQHWQEALGRRGALKWKSVHGNLLLHTHVFAAGKKLLLLRVAHEKAKERLHRERWVTGMLRGTELVPELIEQRCEVITGPHHFLVTESGHAVEGWMPQVLAAVGGALGRLHSEADVSIRLRAPALGFTSLMAAFQSLADDVKQYLARREQDGLPQDLLTLSLSDLMRALRRYVAAAEHHFLPPPPRVLCHGRLEPSRILSRSDGGVMLLGLEHCVAGDGAWDLAQLAEEANLAEPQLMELLDAYHQARGRVDGLLIPRLCALRVLHRLRRAVVSLRELQQLADVLEAGVGDYGTYLDRWLTAARERVMQAFNGLVDFTGPARPLSLAEVEAMGALLAVEELHLRGKQPVIGVEGAPYTGKTPLSQELAARLRVPWVGVAAVVRAAAWATGHAQSATAKDLADMISRLQVNVANGKLRLMWDGQDSLEASRVAVGSPGTELEFAL